MDEVQKNTILEFLRKHHLGVVSSINAAGTPESAVVGFSETNNLEILFDTLVNSRKYQNIKQNPHVAFVTGWDESGTLQVEGTARELTGEESERYLTEYLQKLPQEMRFIRAGAALFIITPTKIRLTDYTKQPLAIIEPTI